MNQRLPLNSITQAVAVRLKADMETTPACPVFSYVPQNEAFPYVVIGQFVANDDSSKTHYQWDVEFPITVWSNKETNLEVNALLDRVIASLTRPPPLELADDWTITFERVGFAEAFPISVEEGPLQQGMVRMKWKIRDMRRTSS